MITITEMILKLKKNIDNEIEGIMIALAKKGTDSNSFILEEVRKCFETICLIYNEIKVLPVLFNLANTKSVLGKINLAFCMETIVKKIFSRR